MVSGPSSFRTLKEWTRTPPVAKKMVEIMMTAARNGNDRAVALIGGAYVDRALEDLIISKKLVTLTKTERSQLFENDAPLASFSAKIRIAYAMGLIGDGVRKDLDTIRSIRNAFAHSLHEIDFSVSEVRTVCARFKSHKTIITSEEEDAKYKSRELGAFTAVCAIYTGMMQDLAADQAADLIILTSLGTEVSMKLLPTSYEKSPGRTLKRRPRADRTGQ